MDGKPLVWKAQQNTKKKVYDEKFAKSIQA